MLASSSQFLSQAVFFTDQCELHAGIERQLRRVLMGGAASSKESFEGEQGSQKVAATSPLLYSSTGDALMFDFVPLGRIKIFRRVRIHAFLAYA